MEGQNGQSAAGPAPGGADAEAFDDSGAKRKSDQISAPGNVSETLQAKRLKLIEEEGSSLQRCVTPDATLKAEPDLHTPHHQGVRTASPTDDKTAEGAGSASEPSGATPTTKEPSTKEQPPQKSNDVFSFFVVTNDGEEDSVVSLMNAKKIFATQLPKMPREYIVRLVMDRRHETLCLVKNGKEVIGGVCYRPNAQQGFAEIAFLAVDSAEQVRGHGTRLMNELKERVKKNNISYFLTYADNYAIGHFKKQGFTKTINFEERKWRGYIKDYDGGTLMQCYIDKGVNYNEFSVLLKKQQLEIYKRIVKNTKAHYVYSGLKCDFASGQTIENVMDIPGVRQAGWSGPPRLVGRRGKLDEDQTLAAALEKVYDQIYMHSSAWPFHKPVDMDLYPHYQEEIKEPIDMTLIRSRLDGHAYTSKDAFEVDISKMCQNCRTFNGDNSAYGKCATVIEKFARSLLRRTLRSMSNGDSK